MDLCLASAAGLIFIECRGSTEKVASFHQTISWGKLPKTEELKYMHTYTFRGWNRRKTRMLSRVVLFASGRTQHKQSTWQSLSKTFFTICENNFFTKKKKNYVFCCREVRQKEQWTPNQHSASGYFFSFVARLLQAEITQPCNQ